MSLWGTYLEELLDLSFNGKSLQEITGGQVTDHNFDEMPEISSSRSAVASAHRSITTGGFYTGKRAVVNIAVAGEFHELQAILGRVRQLIQYKNRDLVLVRGIPKLVAGVYDLTDTDTITFKQANVTGADMNHNAAKGTVITVEFLLDDPVGVGSDTQTLLTANNITTSSQSLDLSAIDVQGTFQEQYPIYEFTINSITNGSNPSLTITLGLTEIVISQALAASDILIVDTEAMRVTLNGELIDFSGAFPFIADTEAIIYMTNTFTARNISYEVTNNPRYI